MALGYDADPMPARQSLRTHTCGELRPAQVGERVRLAGWVHRRRDHGHLTFFDLRDREGLLQVVFDPDNAGVFAAGERLRNEYVVQVTGKVRHRPPGTTNPKLKSGEVELLATGRWRKHLDRLQQRLGRARSLAVRQLGECGIEFDHPGEAGLFVWGRVPAGVDVEVLARDAYANGILLARGSSYFAEGGASDHLRFNVVFSQHVRLHEHLSQRLSAVSRGRAAVARAALPRA